MALIGLDIGHGNNTFPSGKGVYKNGKGYAEHDFNAKLGIAIKKLLEDNGHKVVLGQQPNKPDVALRTRTNRYNRDKVDLVISLHANAGGGNGRCVFYWGTSSKSKSLAVSVRDAIKAKGYSTHGNGLHAGKRGSWTNLHINRETNMPAILVEHGFMDNSKDFDLIFGSKQDKYIKDMAEADVKGIQNWLGKSFKGEATVKPDKTVKPTPNKPSSSSGGSIVDYMNRNKMNSSFANRKVLATKHGISNYKGTASQNNQLLAKLKAPSKPTSSGGSVVDYMNKNKMDASYSNRKKLASRYGISGYTGTASQNNQLLSKLQGGSSPKKKSINQMAKEIINKEHGTGHTKRRASLNINKNEYSKVKKEVNRIEGIKTAKPNRLRAGHTITTKTVYTTSNSTKNTRRSPIKGYISDIDNSRRNPIRLRNKKGGYYIGFTRSSDII